MRERDPYKIEAPFVVQFSGGKTSAYMLWKILEAYEGELPDDAVVAFQNTGKEREETLDFVHEVETRWGVNIVWLEYFLIEEEAGDGLTINKHSFRVVNYERAARDGAPFSAVIKKKQYLPNPMSRFCTSELKVKTRDRYLKSIGIKDFDSAVGIRYDEPRRWSKMKIPTRHNANVVMPLVDAKVDHQEVLKFWEAQDFKLELMQHEGNCDLCFLKGKGKIAEILVRRPGLADWWSSQELNNYGRTEEAGKFRYDRPSYAALKKMAINQNQLFDMSEESISCFCGD